MKAGLIIVTLTVLLLTGCCSFGQDFYADSLAAYQKKYKAGLYKIIQSDTACIDFYPLDRSLAIVATVEILQAEPPFKLMTFSGKTKEARKYARLTFTLSGKTYSLYAYQLLKLLEKEETATHLFVPFTDETCGITSYGGGRYIDLDIRNISNGRIQVDFNRAYNPYCAFAAGYNCPVPPAENSLPIAVRAGERYYADKFAR